MMKSQDSQAMQSSAKSDFIVVEVDESDKSLSAFHPDYAVLLNVGNDHYGQDELCQVFADFSHELKGIAIWIPEGLAGIQGKTIVNRRTTPGKCYCAK